MVTGATDGTVAVWRLTGPALETVVPDSHQSGVNCLSMSCGSDGVVNFVSGGDDQAVTYSTWSPVTGQCQTVSSTLHAAAVRGVHLDGEYAVSAGADQRVILWHAGAELCALSMVVVEVADLSTLCVSGVLNDGSRLCVVAGLGLATIRWWGEELTKEIVNPLKKAKSK